jgi:hypothetical protein
MYRSSNLMMMIFEQYLRGREDIVMMVRFQDSDEVDEAPVDHPGDGLAPLCRGESREQDAEASSGGSNPRVRAPGILKPTARTRRVHARPGAKRVRREERK